MKLSSKEKLDIIHKIIGILLCILIVFFLLNIVYGKKPYVEYLSDQEDITCVDNGTCHIIKCTIKTAGKVIQPVLTLETHKFGIEVYFNGRLIYSKNDDSSKYSYGLDTVDLPANYAGSSLQIRYYQKEPSAAFTFPTMRIISAFDYSTEFIRHVYVKISISLAIFACGICFAVCVFLKKVDILLESNIRYTSLFLIFSSIWTITGTGALRILSLTEQTMYYIEYISMYASILIILFFLYEKLKPTGIQKTIYYILTASLCVYIAISIILQILDITTFYSTLVLFQGIVVLCAIYFISIACKKFLFDSQITFHTLAIMILIVCFIAIALIEVVKSASSSYYFGDSVLPYIILGYAIYSISKFINYAMVGYSNKYEESTLNKMAYTDLMSGIGNRNSCENHFSSIMLDIKNTYQIAMFDINGLKIVNDTLGHTQGDQLIIEFANLLKTEFDSPDYFIGRMGGDEFILTFLGDEQTLLNKITHLDIAVENVNASSKHPFDISYSYGLSNCNRANGDDIWIKYSESDNEMYRNKHKLHEQGV